MQNQKIFIVGNDHAPIIAREGKLFVIGCVEKSLF
jgi:hypothetical protein